MSQIERQKNKKELLIAEGHRVLGVTGGVLSLIGIGILTASGVSKDPELYSAGAVMVTTGYSLISSGILYEIVRETFVESPTLRKED